MQHTQQRKQLSESFPLSGKTRAKQNAAFLGIAESTFWKYCNEGNLNQIDKVLRIILTTVKLLNIGD